ncbi:aquaporin-9-like isoform X1 [Oppia nitens]|uniref:aquaporin-9-like isoform X1 n=1 Tax=Oppia nitens TaxID=1686743 RepID=UPI0023DBA2AC|nr:aquaporin-9-like isoform X1 [Oppia nitens]
MSRFRIKNQTIREFLAELLGTFTLTCVGCSGGAYMTVAKEGGISHAVGPWIWGMGLTAAIYVCGGVSGGHVNPAVTLGMASVGKLPWRKVIHYFLGQYIGAFLAAVVTYCVYREAILNTFDHKLLTTGPNATAGIFGTFPAAGITTLTTVIDQIVAVGFFLLLINAITDEKNMACPKGLVPIAIGMTDLGLLVFAFGYNCGGPINPARDFSPRLFSAMAGWGTEVFSVNNYGYFWVPFVGCHIGGIVGCWIYKLFIENHWPDESYDFPNSNESENYNVSSKNIAVNSIEPI